MSKACMELSATIIAVALLAACGGSESGSAAAQPSEDAIRACELVTVADVTPLMGAMLDEPDPYESDFGSSRSSLCTFTGERGAVLVRVVYPFGDAERTSAEWAAELQAERDRSVENEDDAELTAMFADAPPFEPLEGLGVPAAVEDLREMASQVAVHALDSRHGGIRVTVHANDVETARALVEAALAKIP